MIIDFRRVSLVFSLLSLGLAIVYMACPGLMLWMFGIASETGGLVMARRGGALFLGVAILVYLARATDDRAVRIAIASGLSAMCAALAALGVVDLALGHVKAGIFLAAGTEIVFAVGYLIVLRQEKRALA